MSSKHQGQKNDGISGEEAGKIHHEYPGVVVREPYLTTFNACDTTALYLIGLELYGNLSKPDGADADFIKSQRLNITRAIDYINSHIMDDVFWEFPSAGARQFSLRITSWKDSMSPSGNQEELEYPVAYSLVQFQVARGLLAAGRLLDRADLRKRADRMFRAGIREFIGNNSFCVQRTRDTRLELSSSDELHALAYIPREYADRLPLDAIIYRAQELLTPAGIACISKNANARLSDTYHGYVVWIFEQSMIHYGAKKFGLRDIAAVTEKCIPFIGNGQELLSIVPDIAPLGNDRQLWSVAAKIYFSDAPSLCSTTML